MTKLSMDRIIQRHLLHTNQLRLNFDGKLFKRFAKQVKQLQLNNNAAPEAMAYKTTRKKKKKKQVKRLQLHRNVNKLETIQRRATRFILKSNGHLDVDFPQV